MTPRLAPVCLLLAGATLVLGCGDSKPPPVARATAAATPAVVAVVGEQASPAVSDPGTARTIRTTGTGAVSATPAAPPGSGGVASRQTPATAEARLDPCALVTREEATAALGEPAAAPLVQRTSLLAQCQYGPAAMPATPGAAGRVAITVQIFPRGAGDWALRKATFARTQPVQAVSGVGEDAFWVETERALFVLSRGVIFAIRVSGRPPAAALTAAKALAQTAAGRV